MTLIKNKILYVRSKLNGIKNFLFVSTFIFSSFSMGSAKRYTEHNHYDSLRIDFKVSAGNILTASIDGREEVGRQSVEQCQELMSSVWRDSFGLPPENRPMFYKTDSHYKISPSRRELKTVNYLKVGGYCQWGLNYKTTTSFSMKLPYDNEDITFDFIFLPLQGASKTTTVISNAYVMVYPHFYIIPSCEVEQEWSLGKNGKITCTLQKKLDYDRSIKALMNYKHLDIYIDPPQMPIQPNMTYNVDINFIE